MYVYLYSTKNQGHYALAERQFSLNVIGPIPWGHSGPLCHALSLSSSSSWTSMRRRLIKTTASIITTFCRVIETPKYAPNKSKMAEGRHLEKWKNLYIFATDWPIVTKFGMLMHLHPVESNSQCDSSDTWWMGVRRLAVANGSNIFQMLLVLYF